MIDIHLFLIVCVGFLFRVFCAHLPSELKTCSRSHPDFNECVRSSMEDAIRKLAHGNKQLGLIPLEPLHVDLITVPRSPNSAVNIDQKFTNVKLYGLSSSKINKFEVNTDTYNLFVEAFTPVLRTEADFEMKGQLLIFPINGKGPSNITMTNLISYHNVSGELHKKKGRDYLRLTNYKITIKPEDIQYKFHNVLGGPERASLNEQVDRVINENSLSIFEEVRPATEESYAIVFREIANQIFNKVPLDEIYKI